MLAIARQLEQPLLESKVPPMVGQEPDSEKEVKRLRELVQQRDTEISTYLFSSVFQ